MIERADWIVLGNIPSVDYDMPVGNNLHFSAEQPPFDSTIAVSPIGSATLLRRGIHMGAVLGHGLLLHALTLPGRR